MIPSREVLLEGFVFESWKIDWSFYEENFPGTSDDNVYLMECAIQRNEYIKQSIREYKIDQILN